jgi:GT2 family glycosyltransferase
MTEALVTVVVVPRERFSVSSQALETLYLNTHAPFRLVYVDGGSPPRIWRHLEAESRRAGFQLIRTSHYLTPNEARNAAFQYVATKYVAFIDNDVFVTPGWLETLVKCAEETNAWVVGPLYLMGELSKQIVHMAGGVVEIEDRGDVRLFRERHHYPHTPLAAIGDRLTRRATDLVEFHCMLVRRDALQRLGGLDEGLMSAYEHVDLCMMVRQAGGTVYLEPDAVVSYMGPHPLRLSDLPFYLLRWSEAWNAASVRHFNQKWKVAIEKDFSVWLTKHRRSFLEPLRARLQGVVGWRVGTFLERTFAHPLEAACTRMIAWRASKRTPARITRRIPS